MFSTNIVNIWLQLKIRWIRPKIGIYYNVTAVQIENTRNLSFGNGNGKH